MSENEMTVAKALAERDHWKHHAEEAGEGFSQVCRDMARISARNVDLCRERDDLYAKLARVEELTAEYEREGMRPVLPSHFTYLAIAKRYRIALGQETSA